MPLFSIIEAEANLRNLVDRALAGEEILIGRYGKPEVKLVPIQEAPHSALTEDNGDS